MEKTYDLAIIGGGPVGMFAGYFAALHGLKSIILESLSELGGQPNAIYPVKTIRDIPVYSEITGKELTEKLSNQIIAKNVDIKTNFKVLSISKEETKTFVLNDEVEAKSILITTGNGAFSPKEIPFDYDKQLDEHLHYFVTNPITFKDKTVGILGGGDSALDWAELLAEHDAQVKLIHRRDNFRGLESTVQKLIAHPNVEFVTPFLPVSLTKGEDKNLSLELKKIRTEELNKLEFDEIIVAYGFNTNNDVVEDWGIQTERGFIQVSRSMETNIPSIYAAGDTVMYENRVPIIGLGFGEVQIAITSIAREVFPDKQLTLHSTSI